jgi:hypothetical protein
VRMIKRTETREITPASERGSVRQLAATYWPDLIALPPELSEEQMARHDDKKPIEPKAEDQSHKPAKHIEETARLAGSVETSKDPGKVRRTKD